MIEPRYRLPEAIAVLGFFVLATFLLFWPAFARPGQEVFRTPGVLQADGFLITWILAWDFHALANAPGQLFDANIFYPARGVLAGSEHMLGHLPLFAPAYALTDNPVFAIQFTRLMTMSLCGAAMYALLRHWGAGWAAALFGGFVYAFCPARYSTVHALQLVAMPYLPLSLLFLDRTLTRGRWTAASLLFVSLSLQMLCSFYLAYMSAAAIGLYVVVSWWCRRSSGSVSHWTPVAVALSAVVVLMVLTALPYAGLASRGDIPAHAESMLVGFSASPLSTYTTRPVFTGFARLGDAYVGIVPGMLLLVALFQAVRGGGVFRLPLLAAAAIAFAMYVLALGPVLEIGELRLPLPYKLANAIVPGFSAMRVPLRFTFGFLVGFAALAGLGLQILLSWFGPVPRPSLVAGVTLMAMLSTSVDYGHFEYRPKTQPAPAPSQIPDVYRRLAELESGPTLEIPAALQGQDSFAALDREARYALLSTYHWNPLLNGYTGYPPPSAPVVLGLAKQLPDARALRLLQRMAGLRYVVVHLSELPPQVRGGWQAVDGLEKLGRFGDDLLFRTTNQIAADLVEVVRDGPEVDRTLLGNSIEVVDSSERDAGLRILEPDLETTRPLAGLPIRLVAQVDNRSASVWPVLTDATDRAVSLGYRWTRDGREVSRGSLRLPYDLGAGESARIVTSLAVPGPAGRYGLELAVTQGGRRFPDSVSVQTVHVREIPPGL